MAAHESAMRIWVKRARELAQSSGAELSAADLSRLDPENPRRVFVWWRKFEQNLRSLVAEAQEGESDPLTDDQILVLMASSNVRYFRGSLSGIFSNGRVVKAIRHMALEYGRRHGGIFGPDPPKSPHTRDAAQKREREEQTVPNGDAGDDESRTEREQATAEAGRGRETPPTAGAATAAAAAEGPAPAPNTSAATRPAPGRSLDALLRGGEIGEALAAAVASIQRAPPRKEATEAFVARVLCHVGIWAQRPAGTEPPAEACFTAPDATAMTRQRRHSLGRKATVLRRRVMRTCLQVRGHGCSPEAVLSSAFGAFVARLEAGVEVGAVLDALEADLDEANELRVPKRARTEGDPPFPHT